MPEASSSPEIVPGSDVCTRCGGSGWIIIERDGISGAERCDCALVGRADRMEAAAGIPPLYRRVTLDNFVMPNDNPPAKKTLGTVLMQVTKFARDFPFDDRPGLLLIGDAGVGKTHLAVGVLRALISRGFEGIFFDYQTLLDKIRSGYDAASGASDREAYRAALDSDILVLDDLGAHRVTEWVEDTVTSIITHRCNNRKPLIATTNLPDNLPLSDSKGGGTRDYRKSLGEVIGMRARSRLHEMCRVITMPDVEDYRMRRGPTSGATSP